MRINAVNDSVRALLSPDLYLTLRSTAYYSRSQTPPPKGTKDLAHLLLTRQLRILDYLSTYQCNAPLPVYGTSGIMWGV